jgi:hypothetical protein
MADTKISALPAATTPLAGTEVLPIVQGGVTEKVAVDDLTVKNVRSNATSGILQVTGPAAAATRVMTTPDATFTAARTDAAQSFTGDQTLSTGNLVIGTAGKGIAYPVSGGGSAVQPVFSATANTTQSILAATWTKVDFANELFDSNGDFASSTFTPTVAGYYQLNAGVYWASDPGFIIVSIYRSGNPFVEIGRITTSSGGQINGSALIFADGTSHTFEIYCRSANANTLNDSSNTTLVTFNGSLVRGA